MSELRQGLFGLLFALLSALVIFGGAVLSLVESDTIKAKSASATYLAAWDMSVVEQYTPAPGEPTYTAVPVGKETLTSTPTFGPVAACPVPPGWSSIMVQPGDSLIGLAEMFQVSTMELAQANCLANDQLELSSGTFLFVPVPTPTLFVLVDTPTLVKALVTLVNTPTKTICGVPAGWVLYRVRSGDTLYSLSRLTGVSVFQIQQANCMGSSTLIVTGQSIYLPFIPIIPVLPSLTPLPTAIIPTYTLVPTPTISIPSPTLTWTSLPPSATSSATATNIPPSSTSTQTQIPTETNTPLPPTATPIPPTATDEPIPTVTETSILPTSPPNPSNFGEIMTTPNPDGTLAD